MCVEWWFRGLIHLPKIFFFPREVIKFFIPEDCLLVCIFVSKTEEGFTKVYRETGRDKCTRMKRLFSWCDVKSHFALYTCLCRLDFFFDFFGTDVGMIFFSFFLFFKVLKLMSV